MELKTLKEVLDKREEKKNSTEDIIKMAELVLKNNYFEFNGQVKHQISSTLALKSSKENIMLPDLTETNLQQSNILSLQISINICIIHLHTRPTLTVL